MTEPDGTQPPQPPPYYRTKLGVWATTWRVLLVLVMTATLLGVAAVDAATGAAVDRQAAWRGPFELVAFAVSFAAMFWRRRRPLVALSVTGGLALFSMLAGAPFVLVLTSVATMRRWPLIVYALVLCFGSQFSPFIPLNDYSDMGTGAIITLVVMSVLFNAANTALGMYIGSRRELKWIAAERVRREVVEQRARVTQARTDERARIAREMHDVLAHRLSRVSMQAGALAFREDLPADELRAGLSEVRDNANAALDDLRSVLGVLRSDHTDTALTRPQPTLADLPQLFSEAQASGQQVIFADQLTTPPSERISRTLYRVVQECLTNAYKHAPGKTVTVTLAHQDDGVQLVVRNDRPVSGVQGAPGSGLGLVGMAERVELVGGTFGYGADNHGFVVRAWLPASE